jgi:chorismate mutase
MLRSVRFATTVHNQEEQIVRKLSEIGQVVA